MCPGDCAVMWQVVEMRRCFDQPVPWPALHSTHLMSKLPRKLKKDAIVEAICEVRFECGEVPELVVGRLADIRPWKEFSKRRLPASDIPAPIREQEARFKYQPTLELLNVKDSRVVKVGSHVLSYHVLKPYCGWGKFQPEIKQMYKLIFNLFDNFMATRFGFRYVNALTKQDHLISNIEGLNASVVVAGKKMGAPLNLNYNVKHSDEHEVLIRISSPEFLQGPAPEEVTTLIDVDVFTPSEFNTTDVKHAIKWTKSAHEYEKQEFFRLIPKNILKQLVED